MARPFNELRAKMSPERRERNHQRAMELLSQLPLTELRHARQLSQEQLAGVLHVKQASISKLERRTDMYISTLRNFIRAMGGELEIIARFPDGSVKINQFEELEESAG
ncbi:MAG: XRE family transcriptional regulator [Deltaproteobacteria bacterium]|nr:XRE family transcriptional regulator [Deltaproteobacteria bacterium]